MPFKIGQAKYKTGQIRLAGHHFSLRDSYGLSQYELRSGSFSEDSRGRWYRQHERELAKAQRARKKKRVKAIHAKIKNQRKDDLHKLSTALVRNNAAIFVGDVASAKLVKTTMAKFTLDAGWAMLKTMLDNKSRQAGAVFEVVNAAFSRRGIAVWQQESPSFRAGRMSTVTASTIPCLARNWSNSVPTSAKARSPSWALGTPVDRSE